MKPPAFDYCRPRSLDEAIEVLAEMGEDARIIAGGQSLVPMLNMRLIRPQMLVDIAGMDELRYIRVTERHVEIGAAATQFDLECWDGLVETLPLVAQAIPEIGHFQTRNRGTVCGSICHADPSSELPLCLALQGGEVELASARGTRTLSADEFQLGLLMTARAPDELVSCVRFPVSDGQTRSAFREFTRRHGDFAVVAAAATVTDGTIRIGIGGVADRPEVIAWNDLPDSELDDALNDLAWALEATDDIHASARYRRELVRFLGRAVIEEAQQ